VPRWAGCDDETYDGIAECFMSSAPPGPGGPETNAGAEEPGPVHALFQQRVAGDDALLKLARLRFAQMGVAAEVYADTPEQLDYVLRFVPPHHRPPMVHMNRGLNVLHERDRAVVTGFATRFAGRITGLVVHDRQGMADHTGELIAAMRDLNAGLEKLPDRVMVFLEYAAGFDPGWFVDVAQRLRDAERVGSCIDIGHLGIRQASVRFGRHHPGLGLTPADDRLPDLIGDIQDAVNAARSDVLDVTRSLGQLGKQLHFHLHDGHPLIPGLSDHFSFLTRLPIPFSYHGRRSLATMYGPGGLASVVSTAIAASPPRHTSFTIEVHQAEGRLPLADAAPLFQHWRDTTNAERLNYWLSVLSENAILLSEALRNGAH
jgi:hypothetical protein